LTEAAQLGDTTGSLSTQAQHLVQLGLLLKQAHWGSWALCRQQLLVNATEAEHSTSTEPVQP